LIYSNIIYLQLITFTERLTADRPTERQASGEIRLQTHTDEGPQGARDRWLGYKMPKIRLTGLMYGLDFDQ
jgi:hypothetical protein